MKSLYKYLMIGLTTLLFATGANAQPFGVNVVPVQVESKGGVLYIHLDMDITGMHIKSNQSIVLTPVLQSNDKLQTLPEIIINGVKRNISYKRVIDRRRVVQPYTEPYIVERVNKRSNDVIIYKIEMPFEPWMDNAKLLLVADMYSCADTKVYIATQPISQIKSEKKIVPRIVSPSLTYISANVEAVKSKQDSIVSSFYFPLSTSNILIDYSNNRAELANTEAILTDKKLNITDMKIIGSASPSGSDRFNEQLSKTRALSFASFMDSSYRIPVQTDKIKWIGADWNGLVKLVEQSNMAFKEDVLNIIKNTGVSSEREAGLMRLESGRVNRYMQETLFPLLRRVSYTITYDEPKFDIQKGRSVIISNPKSLSFEQMMLVADSYPIGSVDYNNVINIAVKSYPDNMIANINASSVALRSGNAALAKQYLSRFVEQPEAWNNMGVVYLLDGDYESAYKYLNKASLNGSKEAKSNLEIINNMGASSLSQ